MEFESMGLSLVEKAQLNKILADWNQIQRERYQLDLRKEKLRQKIQKILAEHIGDDPMITYRSEESRMGTTLALSPGPGGVWDYRVRVYPIRRGAHVYE
jgi:hypothetical protein